MGRPGRPPKPESERRSKTYPVRFTPGEWDLLKSKAELGGVSVGELIRASALGRRVKSRPRVPEVNRAAWAEMARLSGLLAQLLNAHRYGETLDLRSGLLEDLRTALLEVRSGLLGRQPLDRER